MISIIVCSIRESLRKTLTTNVAETIGIDHEMVIIENEKTNYSISKAYNIGAAQAKYPYLCFVHEDIIFHTPVWGKRLINHFTETQARLIGILGSTIKTRAHSSVHIPYPKLNRHCQLQRYENNVLDHFYENPYNEQKAEVCVLDGLFIAATKSAWEETKFSEDYLTGFHGYDIDFSLKNFQRGKVIVVYDILLEHMSLGTFSKNWIDTQLLVTKRWKKHLPLAATSASKIDIRNAEITNLKQFLQFLIQLNYKRRLQLICLARLMIIYPNLRHYHFIFRTVVFGKTIDNKLKHSFLKARHSLKKCLA
jgi:glycosyltransferase involved in cell wall biosynthesis